MSRTIRYSSEKCNTAGGIQSMNGNGCNQSFVAFKMRHLNLNNGHPTLNREHWCCWEITQGYLKLLKSYEEGGN